MPNYRLRCAGCNGTYVVEASSDAERCPRCGTQHTAPWADPAVGSSPLPDGELGVPASEAIEETGDGITTAGDGEDEISLTISVD